MCALAGCTLSHPPTSSATLSVTHWGVYCTRNTHAHAYIHVCMCTRMHSHVDMHACIHAHAQSRAHIYTAMTCICAHTCRALCTCSQLCRSHMCVCIPLAHRLGRGPTSEFQDTCSYGLEAAQGLRVAQTVEQGWAQSSQPSGVESLGEMEATACCGLGS